MDCSTSRKSTALNLKLNDERNHVVNYIVFSSVSNSSQSRRPLLSEKFTAITQKSILKCSLFEFVKTFIL